MVILDRHLKFSSLMGFPKLSKGFDTHVWGSLFELCSIYLTLSQSIYLFCLSCLSIYLSALRPYSNFPSPYISPLGREVCIYLEGGMLLFKCCHDSYCIHPAHSDFVASSYHCLYGVTQLAREPRQEFRATLLGLLGCGCPKSPIPQRKKR